MSSSEEIVKDTNSWNGPPPPIPEDLVPLDLPKFDFPADFAAKYNSNWAPALAEICNKSPELKNEESMANFLFYCPGIAPSSITSHFLTKGQNSQSLFYHYFSSVNLGYLDIVLAAKYLLSRVAFPYNFDSILLILTSMASAYLAANPLSKLDRDELVRVILSALIVSGCSSGTSKFTVEEFVKLLPKTSFTQEAIGKFYETAIKNPISIFFTFAATSTLPELDKQGWLKKIGGIFKSKTNRWFAIDHFILRYFKDQKMTHPCGEMDIANTISAFVPAQGKESEYLLIKNQDGSAIGYKISKGIRKKSNHTSYIAYGADSETLKCWANTLNIVAFWNTLITRIPTMAKQN